jgi:hypothetical protein
MFTDMPRDCPAINVKAAAGAETHDDTHGFSLVERLLRTGRHRDHNQQTNNRQPGEKLHSLPFRK